VCDGIVDDFVWDAGHYFEAVRAGKMQILAHFELKKDPQSKKRVS
jgi:hypothetical protein